MLSDVMRPPGYRDSCGESTGKGDDSWRASCPRLLGAGTERVPMTGPAIGTEGGSMAVADSEFKLVVLVPADVGEEDNGVTSPK